MLHATAGTGHARSMSPTEIAVVCGGVQSMTAEGGEATINADGRTFRIEGAQGSLQVFEGGVKLATIKDFTQKGYNECVIALSEINQSSSAPIRYPIFQGTVEVAAHVEGNQRLLSFLQESHGQTVYLDVLTWFAISPLVTHVTYETCTPDGSDADDYATYISLPLASFNDVAEAMDWADYRHLEEQQNAGSMWERIERFVSAKIGLSYVGQLRDRCSIPIKIEHGEYWGRGSAGSSASYEEYRGFYKVLNTVHYNQRVITLTEVEATNLEWQAVQRQLGEDNQLETHSR